MPIDVKDAHGVTQSVPTLADIQPALDAILARLPSTPLTQGLTDAQLRAAALSILLPTGASTEGKQDAAIAALDAILAALPTNPASGSKQDTSNTILTGILSKIITAPATEAKQTTGNTTLTDILAKLSASPATSTLQSSGNDLLSELSAKLSALILAGGTEASLQALITWVSDISDWVKNHQPTYPQMANLLNYVSQLSIAMQDVPKKSDSVVVVANTVVDALNELRSTMMRDGDTLHAQTLAMSASTDAVYCRYYEAIQILLVGGVDLPTTEVVVEGSDDGTVWSPVTPLTSKGLPVTEVEPTATGVSVWVIPEFTFYRVTTTFSGSIVPLDVSFVGRLSAVMHATSEGQQSQLSMMNEQRLRLLDVMTKLDAVIAYLNGNGDGLAVHSPNGMGVLVENFPSTQYIAATALPLPNGAATQATLALVLAALQSSLSVTGPLTDAQLRATPVPVTGSISVEPAPGAATEAKQDALLAMFKAEDTPAASGTSGVPMLAMRADSDAPTADDGDWTVPKMDEEGRLKVATKPASIASVVGVANTVASTVVCDVRRASNVVFHVRNIGSVTLGAGTFVFEASIDSTNGTDGTWFGIQAVRSNANTIETSIALSGITASSGYAASWEASVNGYQWMRLRCTVAVTASASAQWTIQRGSYATEPIPAAQVSATQAVSGSVTVTPATASSSNINSAASINASTVKGAAGSVYNVAAFNSGAAAAYVKLYNKASAPAPATDVPVIVLPVPAGASASLQFGAVGHRFALGIAMVITGGAGDTDTTAVAASQVKVATSYI